jgi:hypothetical protein
MSTETQSRLAGLITAVLLLPIYFLFVHFHERSRGLVVETATLVACAAAYSLRREPNRGHLLSLVGIIYLVQLIIALLIPLPAKIPGAAMIPIAYIDLLLVIGIVALFQRSHRPTSEP